MGKHFKEHIKRAWGTWAFGGRLDSVSAMTNKIWQK